MLRLRTADAPHTIGLLLAVLLAVMVLLQISKAMKLIEAVLTCKPDPGDEREYMCVYICV